MYAGEGVDGAPEDVVRALADKGLAAIIDR
jgi:hypothetical protein